MSNKSNYTQFTAGQLHAFSTKVFEYFGVPEADALLASDVLSYSDIRGIDSHGIARLHTYFDMLSFKRINPKPNIKIARERKSAATVDGDNGLGLVVGPKAHQIALEKAREYGTGFISVNNTNHYGAAGYYAEKALEHDLVSWAMTNSTKLVAPLWGAERMLGTNPIAIAFPAAKNPPVVIDMATSAAAYGKVEIARRKGENMPIGWGIDKDGQNTDRPMGMIEGGALLPLGSERERGGHKGYCLASMVDILCCVFSGANWGPFAPPFALRQEIPKRSVGKGIGHFFGAMDINAFRDLDEFKVEMDDWIETFRNTKPQPGTDGPLIPGDPEREAMQERTKNGIPVIDKVVEELEDISKKTGINF